MHGRIYGPPQDDPRHRKTQGLHQRSVAVQMKRSIVAGLGVGFLSAIWLHAFPPMVLVLGASTVVILGVQVAWSRFRDG